MAEFSKAIDEMRLETTVKSHSPTVPSSLRPGDGDMVLVWYKKSKT